MNELLVKPESPFILNKETRRKFISIFKEDPKLKWWGLTEEILNHLPSGANNFDVFASILSSYRDISKPGADIILFKAERLMHLFDRLTLLSMAGNIYFLSIIRDCRGVYASQKMTKFPDTDKFMSRNPVQTAINWNTFVYKALQMEKAGKMQLIKYEELVKKTEKVFFQLLKKMKILSFEVNKLKGDLFDRLPESHRVIHNNIKGNTIVSKCSSWRKHLSNDEIFILQKFTGKQLSLLGYELDGNKDTYFLLYFRIVFFYTSHMLVRLFKKIIFHTSRLIKNLGTALTNLFCFNLL